MEVTFNEQTTWRKKLQRIKINSKHSKCYLCQSKITIIAPSIPIKPINTKTARSIFKFKLLSHIEV